MGSTGLAGSCFGAASPPISGRGVPSAATFCGSGWFAAPRLIGRCELGEAALAIATIARGGRLPEQGLPAPRQFRDTLLHACALRGRIAAENEDALPVITADRGHFGLDPPRLFGTASGLPFDLGGAIGR